uniref:E3 ubiquitin-protein ligase TM129-like n=1 Tax=Crassostrea virginica TaxID=6565 RepID=A0A8B8F197_CRAVI|nr:E3 ubiquitin-protein ligase TM129-like [Crassostrea virginica]
MGNEETLNVIFTIGYLFFVLCFVAPPSEFVSAGLTIQNVLSEYLGSEQLHFIEYHMKRTAITLLIHSFLPLGYYVGIGLFSPGLGLFTPWNVGLLWKVYLAASLSVVLTCCLLFYLWTRKKYDSHPIAKELALLGNGSSWRAVASSINVEFRRVDKFTTGAPGRRVIVTDSWVMLTSTYYVYVAHQNDIHLSLSKSEEHDIHYESMTSVQFLKFNVVSINPKLKPFSIRLNALEYRDLKDKLTTPIVNARNIVIKQSLSDQFLDAFRHQVNLNQVFHLPEGMEVDTCIGCMQKESDIKLVKLCDSIEAGQCVQCYCRPMWCLECMGKWFASRQDQQRPEVWMSGASPCPTCRAVFCVLDVCKIAQ